MKKLYQKIDNNLLKKHPFHWIIGWHKFLPIIFGLIFLAVCVGVLIPTKIYTYKPPFIITFSYLLGFLALIVFVLFVIRQIKFNSFRIHHKIPYKRSVTIYFSFVIFIFMLALIPYISTELYNYRLIKKVNSITNDLEKDLKILDQNSFFFYTKEAYSINYKNNSKPIKKALTIKFTPEFVIINSIKNPFTNSHKYKYQYRNKLNKNDANTYPIKISKSKAIKGILNFLEVANRFGISVTETDPNIIFNKREVYNRYEGKEHHNLLMINGISNPSNIYRSYKRMLRHYKRADYDLHDLSILYAFLFFAIIIALILWIVISVPIADFGYSILAGALISIFAGLLSSGIYVFTKSDFAIRIFLYLIILIIFLIAFLNKKHTLITRIMKILSQLLIPCLVGLFYFEYFNMKQFNHIKGRGEFYNLVEDSVPIVLLLTIILTIFIYKNVYRNNRMLPK